jgi:hypothetical protein
MSQFNSLFSVGCLPVDGVLSKRDADKSQAHFTDWIFRNDESTIDYNGSSGVDTFFIFLDTKKIFIY